MSDAAEPTDPLDPELPIREHIETMTEQYQESLHTLQNEFEELVSREEIQEETYRTLCNQLKNVSDECGLSTKLNKAMLLLVNATKQKFLISSAMNDSLKESIQAQKQIIRLTEYGNRKMLSIIRKHRPLHTRRLRSNNKLTFTFDQDDMDTMVSYLEYWQSCEAQAATVIAENEGSAQPR